MQIINERELYEDTVEGLADFLGLEMEEVRNFVTDEFIEEVMEEMFEAQAKVIRKFGELNKN